MLWHFVLKRAFGPQRSEPSKISHFKQILIFTVIALTQHIFFIRKTLAVWNSTLLCQNFWNLRIIYVFVCTHIWSIWVEEYSNLYGKCIASTIFLKQQPNLTFSWWLAINPRKVIVKEPKTIKLFEFWRQIINCCSISNLMPSLYQPATFLPLFRFII